MREKKENRRRRERGGKGASHCPFLASLRLLPWREGGRRERKGHRGKEEEKREKRLSSLALRLLFIWSYYAEEGRGKKRGERKREERGEGVCESSL